MSSNEGDSRCRSIFEAVPIPLWELDFSAAKALLDRMRDAGIQDLDTFLQDHTDMVAECAKLVRLTGTNPAALAMVGVESRDALPATLAPIYRTLFRDAFRDALVAVAEGKPHFEAVATSSSADGGDRSILLRWSVDEQAGGDFSRVLVAIVDITELKQAEHMLLRRTVELQERIEELDDFAHTVAHDLKNPLTTIVGFAEAIDEHLDTLPPEQVHEYLRSIAWSGRKMTSIIQELLLLASVRKAEIQTMPLDMARIVGQALQRLVYMVEQSRAEVIVPDSWPLVQGYPPWVEEVWVNYISNAVKYGGRPPRVELGTTVQGLMVRFWVRDNGPGIAPESWPQLFKPFSRLDHVRAEGHGLGLSIVRHIVEKLGGQVGVHSEIGAGSTFYFTLPTVRLDGS